MDIGRNKFKFPKFFSNFELPEESKDQELEVYRICMWGLVERKAFYGTYETIQKGLIVRNDIDIDSKNPSDYSTSCFTTRKKARNLMKYITRKGNPKVIIAEGKTNIECGPCLPTVKDGKPNAHVDWWIYEDSEPQKYFEEVV